MLISKIDQLMSVIAIRSIMDFFAKLTTKKGYFTRKIDPLISMISIHN
jgi:hypothetical protein